MKKHLLFSIVTLILFMAATKVAYCVNVISYAGAPFTFTTGVAVSQPASFSGSTLNGTNPYSITSGSLPSGLSLNTVNGTISGTPTATFSGSVTISAAFKNGTSPNPASVTISITVNLNPKPVISYTSPQTYPATTAITPLSPTNTGSAATGYSAASLPAGLSIDPLTGIISGTPTTIAAATVYPIIATNGAGSSTFNLTITVSVLPPVIVYSPSTYTFTVGSFASTATPTNTGGPVNTYSGTLPAGLTFATDTSGTITGTPTAISAATNYVITATNAGGSTTFTINIAVTNVSSYDWTGATNTDWATPGNWNYNGSLSTTYPGQTTTTSNIVRIGVAANGITKFPVVSSTPPNSIASMTFGSGGPVNLSLTISAGVTLAVTGGFTLNASNEKVTLNGTSTSALTIGGDYLAGSGATFTNNNCPITINGNFTNYTNNASSGTGLLTFNSGNGSFKLRTAKTFTFNKVQFTGAGVALIQHLTGGKFYLSSSGVLTMSGSTKLNIASGNFTLLSDATGSATIAAIPPACQINGSITVQRYIQGSADLTKRGYRLLTSTIFTGTDATAGNSNVYDLQYIANSLFTSGFGRAANGFSVPTTDNPSIYLFREDDPPPPSNSTVFTVAYNWKGVAKINNTTPYMIGTQARNTNYNALDTTTSIPVGNGILVYFRGDKSTTANYISPFGAPQNVTLSATGTLNTGTINVRLWFSNAGNNLGSNLSYTSVYNDVSQYTGSLIGGFNLVGNPYPSTINWEKYNNGAAAGALTGTVTNFIYEFNEASRQYGVYRPILGSDITSEFPAGSVSINGATNLIASGQGFFVQAGAAGQTLTFTENAKTNTQPSPAVLLNMMGKPVAFDAGPKPMLHLKLSTDSVNTDEIVIELNNNASTKFVQGEDAWDLGGSGNIVNFSSFSSDSIKLAINDTPFPGLQPEVVHLFAGGTISGTYTLDRMQLDNLPALYRVWLKDGFTGDSVDLKKTASYTFTVDKSNAATFGANRFTVVFSQDPAMAYHLLSFTASRIGNSPHAEIDWTTTNEQNSTNFTVERSTDGGTTFDVAGGLQSTGAGTYSLVDKNTGPGENLYRLKQEDINNTITYSDTVTVDFGSKNMVAVNAYPNPTTNVINVDVTAKSQGKVAYSIIINDSSGAMVSQATSAQSSWQTGVSNLLPGTYLVNVFDQHNNKLIGQAKFVKL